MSFITVAPTQIKEVAQATGSARFAQDFAHSLGKYFAF
mgnify:CR=1 FL=1